MIVYLIKSGLCLLFLLAVYHLFLEREKMHSFNRWFLIGSIIFSLSVPKILITVPPKIVQLEDDHVLQELTTVPENDLILNTNTPVGNTFSALEIVLISIYLIGFLFFLIRFIKNLRALYKKIIYNIKVKSKNALFVLLKDNILPHSFLHYIFFNKDDYQNGKIEEELFTHELTHVKQKHSFDILFIELIKIIFWFNPAIYLLKKAIQLNHEFLADQSVINTHKNTSTYQYMLLEKASWSKTSYLASNLNYSVTKKRLKMMTKNTSKTIGVLKKIALFPIALGLIYLFSTKIEAQNENIINDDPIDTSQSINIENDENFKIVETINIVVNKNSEILLNNIPVSKENLDKVLNEINTHLSYEEKKSIVEATITATDATKMGLITDLEEIIIKSGVKKITLKRIGEKNTVSSIRVSQNQRSKAIPEDITIYINPENKLLLQNNNQVIKSSYLEKGLIKFNKGVFSKKDILNRKVILVTDTNSNIEFKKEVISILKKIGFKNIILQESNETYHKNIPPPSPVKNNSFYQDQKGATKAMIEEYNKLAKHYNNQNASKVVYKLKEMSRIREIYNAMSDAQKKMQSHYLIIPPHLLLQAVKMMCHLLNL